MPLLNMQQFIRRPRRLFEPLRIQLTWQWDPMTSASFSLDLDFKLLNIKLGRIKDKDQASFMFVRYLDRGFEQACIYKISLKINIY